MAEGPLLSRPPWEGRRIVLGVSGGIAAYKSVQLARDLTALGAQVDVVPTSAASRFVGALSFEGVTGRPVLDTLWAADGAARHLRVASEADLLVVAPATADLIARLAQGRANDLLTTLLLAARAPTLLAPAMNDRMWSHPATRRNVETLREIPWYSIVGPASGALAVGEGVGVGRMVEPEELVERVGCALASVPAAGPNLWRGRRIVVTAGPTREAIDPVRYVGNRSSGRMGYALAREAMLRGAEVTLVSGPTALPDPIGVTVRKVESAREMLESVLQVAASADVLVFAAAVADYRPAVAEEAKKRKESTGSGFTLELTENPDIAMESRAVSSPHAVRVGFALETEELHERAAAKLEAKEFDLIVANPAEEEGAGFDVDTNRVLVLDREGQAEEWPTLSKEEVARRILDRVTPLLEGRTGEGSGGDRE
ncbi:MAG: bifunctional phosphopantothenoylcysteine decarboxylase/phosphopantothenate--cysteine ligase CoaBC [Gemmatimonadota bacterium]